MIKPESFLGRIVALTARTEGPKLHHVLVDAQTMRRIVRQLEDEFNMRGFSVPDRLVYHDVPIMIDNSQGLESAIGVFHQELRVSE